MSRYMKRFVLASLVYLGVAAIFGILNGITDLGYFGTFAHTHFNLLGFMSMIVFGIGYFILPRFNGTELRFESWVPVHFWLANISLIGMVVFRGLSIDTGQELFNILFIVSATVQVVSIFMFIINIWLTLTPSKISGHSTATDSKPLPKAAPAPAPTITVTPDSRVADLVDKLPSNLSVLISAGLRPLAQPGHIDRVRQMGVTLGMAARSHGLDVDAVILQVEEEFKRHGFVISGTSEIGLEIPKSSGGQLSASLLIGDVIKSFPRARPIFERHFGSGCFDCPGQAYESLDMACRMHGVDPQSLLAELEASL